MGCALSSNEKRKQIHLPQENEMKKTALATLALLALVAVAVQADASGIEVLGIEVLSNGNEVVQTHSTNPPVNAYVEAVMNINGVEYIVDTAPVDPVTALATVTFPNVDPGNLVYLCNAQGARVAVVGVPAPSEQLLLD